MADANVIAKAHPTELAWQELWGPVGEAQSLLALYRTQEDDAAWALLAHGVIERLLRDIEALNSVECDHGRQTLEQRANGGMGAMAPMVTKVFDSELDPSRT
jgi:hypothetical protein